MKKKVEIKFERRRESYRGASLIIRRTALGVLGKAWSDGRELASIDSELESDVFEKLCARVDAAIVLETERDAVPYPDQDAYGRALAWNAPRLSAKHRLMLDAHRKARAHTLSGAEIAEAAGFRAWATARSQYSRFGKMLGESMLFQPYDRVQGSPMWISLIAEPDRDGDLGAATRWQMRAQLVAALDASPDL